MKRLEAMINVIDERLDEPQTSEESQHNLRSLKSDFESEISRRTAVGPAEVMRAFSQIQLWGNLAPGVSKAANEDQGFAPTLKQHEKHVPSG